MLKGFKKLSQRGDTIVEVMVVLAILGLAIGISYATASSSLKATKGAQENAQATALLQSQIEAIHNMLPQKDPSKNLLQSNYCISPTYDVIAGAATANDCFRSGLYRVVIDYVPLTNVFNLKATWDDIQGQGTNSVTLVYRDYE